MISPVYKTGPWRSSILSLKNQVMSPTDGGRAANHDTKLQPSLASNSLKTIRYGVVANISRSHNLRDQYRGAQGSIPCTGVSFFCPSWLAPSQMIVASYYDEKKDRTDVFLFVAMFPYLGWMLAKAPFAECMFLESE